MTTATIDLNKDDFISMIARLFLALAYRSFAATQCNALPADIEAGIETIISSNVQEINS